MAEQNQNISTLSPDKLMTAFTQPRLAWCTGLATVIVVAVVAVLSIGDALAYFAGAPAPEETAEATIDPTAGEPTPQAEQMIGATPQDTAAPNAAQQAGGSQPGRGSQPAPENGTTGGTANGAEGGDNAYVQELRQTADPKDIPQEPGLGISLEDTSF